MIVLVTGSRTWWNRKKVLRALWEQHRSDKVDFVVHGGATGADMLADAAAKELGIQTVRLDALWEFHGRSAGPIRNSNQLKVALRLAEHPNSLKVLAFHQNLAESKGTSDMVKRAKKANVSVKVIK